VKQANSAPPPPGGRKPRPAKRVRRGQVVPFRFVLSPRPEDVVAGLLADYREHMDDIAVEQLERLLARLRRGRRFSRADEATISDVRGLVASRKRRPVKKRNGA
jgi:hypothetical protein